MDNGKFNILDTVRNAYVFVWRERAYLVKAAAVPFILHFATALFIQLQASGLSTVAAWLWTLPVEILTAWFVFAEVRLLLLGERIETLSRDAGSVASRLRSMKISVMVSLLISMAALAIALVLESMAAKVATGERGNPVMALVAVGGLAAAFWGLRLMLFPILGAIDFPFRTFLRRVRGIMFSLRLFGMGALCLFPIAIVFQVMATLFLAAVPHEGPVPPIGWAVGFFFGGILSFTATALLAAAGAYALKEMLGPQKQKGQV